jgi:hypothetical protein
MVLGLNLAVFVYPGLVNEERSVFHRDDFKEKKYNSQFKL